MNVANSLSSSMPSTAAYGFCVRVGVENGVGGLVEGQQSCTVMGQNAATTGESVHADVDSVQRTAGPTTSNPH